MFKKSLKISAAAAGLLVAFSVYINSLIPNDLYLFNSDDVSIASLPMVSFEKDKNSLKEVWGTTGQNLKYSAKLFGVIPLKQVNVSQNGERIVSVAGTPFGIKMFSDGVMVVGFTEISTSTGYQSPAKMAGIKMGDVITQLDDTFVRSNDDVEKYIQKKNGAPVKVVYLRDEKQCQTVITPVRDQNTGTFRTGMWVRDSSAGVGTMTFYDVQKGMFAGLGHGIKDTDTQKDIRLLSGEIVPVKIVGLTKSQNGQAGELKGSFISDFAMGKVLANIPSGVYGEVFNPPRDNLMQVASPGEVKTGYAQIITTISSGEPQKYDIEIEKISLSADNQNKNMVIRITDPELLALTGGIVQGMSGSPIIQDGKLVGAVTHVFVNQVERGYGIFAANMIDTMDTVALNNAS